MRAAICVATCLSIISLVEADTPADQQRARELVHALGNRDYRTREKASMELSSLGRAAYASLREGAADADPEVRARCNRLLPHAYELEMKFRLQEFRADRPGGRATELPGWERYRKSIGEDAVARQFFASMLEADCQLADLVENSTPEVGLEQLMARCSVVQQRMNPGNSFHVDSPSQAEIGQLLFLATNPRLKLSGQGLAQINQFLYRNEVGSWFKTGETAPIMKKLLLAWLDRSVDEPTTGMMIANLMNTLQIKELTDLALKLVLEKKSVVYVRASILLALGRMGEKDVVERIQPLITDDSQVAQVVLNRVRSTTQLGDVALAVSIHLSGEKFSDYGFDGIKSRGSASFSYYSMGFENDERRQAARKKWNEWREKNKK
jgi:hypothetical protein